VWNWVVMLALKAKLINVKDMEVVKDVLNQIVMQAPKAKPINV
jgi:hypothetical protein